MMDRFPINPMRQWIKLCETLKRDDHQPAVTTATQIRQYLDLIEASNDMNTFGFAPDQNFPSGGSPSGSTSGGSTSGSSSTPTTTSDDDFWSHQAYKADHPNAEKASDMTGQSMHTPSGVSVKPIPTEVYPNMPEPIPTEPLHSSAAGIFKL